jgi:RNA polymerase sigma-70 factor, ECF subfamily
LASEPVQTGVDGRATVPAEAAALLYERYRDRVFGYCLYMLGSRVEAEDAVQTTFLHAFRALRRGVVPAVEAPWLFKIAENVCLSSRRSAARRRRVETPGDVVLLQDASAAPQPDRDALIGLEDALADMPASQRRAILLREWQGLSYREIGEKLKLSQAAVEALLFRARRTLARNLSVPPAARRGVARVLDFGALAGAVKAAFGGASAVKVAATIAAITTATVVVGSKALGTSEPPSKESGKQVDVAAASSGVELGAPSLQREERTSVAAGRAAPGETPEVEARRAPRRDGGGKENRGGSGTPTATAEAGGGEAPSSGGSTVGPITPPAGLPLSPPPVEVPQLPVQPPSLPVEPPSVPLEPPALPLNPPALPSVPLP